MFYDCGRKMTNLFLSIEERKIERKKERTKERRKRKKEKEKKENKKRENECHLVERPMLITSKLSAS